MTAAFDLVQEPWIAVTRGGVRVEVSLLEALTDAHLIDGLAIDQPLETVAVFRQVLLPVVLDALGPPRDEGEWARRWEAGALDGDRITPGSRSARSLACVRLRTRRNPSPC
jgi:CRISPR system Cascade subunit CasA